MQFVLFFVALVGLSWVILRPRVTCETADIRVPCQLSLQFRVPVFALFFLPSTTAKIGRPSKPNTVKVYVTKDNFTIAQSLQEKFEDMFDFDDKDVRESRSGLEKLLGAAYPGHLAINVATDTDEDYLSVGVRSPAEFQYDTAKPAAFFPPASFHCMITLSSPDFNYEQGLKKIREIKTDIELHQKMYSFLDSGLDNMYVNCVTATKEVLQALGVPVPTSSWPWEVARELAKQPPADTSCIPRGLNLHEDL